MNIISILSMTAAALAMSSVQAATPPDSPCSANFVTTGVYRNVNFGFTIRIPKGLKAKWSSPPCSLGPASDDCVCMNDHGRTIELDGGGTIGIYADHNAMAWTLPTTAFEDLNDFKRAESGGELSVVQLNRITWEAMPAYRYVARSDGAGEAIVRESVVATTRHGEDTFFLYIQAPQKQYDKYRTAFNSMLGSWRVSPIQ